MRENEIPLPAQTLIIVNIDCQLTNMRENETHHCMWRHAFYTFYTIMVVESSSPIGRKVTTIPHSQFVSSSELVP
jgi:hypothetical protein